MEESEKKLNEILMSVISEVNRTLSAYEAEWVSCKRSPEVEKEVCKSFEQYVEARFNYECSKIPELRDLVIQTDGNLFRCVGMDNPDTSKRRFTWVYFELLRPEDLIPEFEFLRPRLEQVRDLLGGTRLKFNNVKKKIKYLIL